MAGPGGPCQPRVRGCGVPAALGWGRGRGAAGEGTGAAMTEAGRGQGPAAKLSPGSTPPTTWGSGHVARGPALTVSTRDGGEGEGERPQVQGRCSHRCGCHFLPWPVRPLPTSSSPGRQASSERAAVPGWGLPVAPVPGTFKLVENAVVLVQGTELAPQIVVNLVREGARVSQSWSPLRDGP